jgi:hypothetical protein
MTKEQVKIIETALCFYHSHCVNQVTRKRGPTNLKPGYTMSAQYKERMETAQDQKNEWHLKADEVYETIYQFDQIASTLIT